MKILDHGYLEVVEHWGSDERIIEAARMSTGKGFQGWVGVEPCPECREAGRLSERDVFLLFRSFLDLENARKNCKTCKGSGLKPGDEKLLRFLYEKKHATPFEMAGLVVEVKAPIMVFREWHRHRTQSYNEMSARYTPLPDENYVPTPDRCLVVNAKNRQAGRAEGAGELTHEQALDWLEHLQRAYAAAEECYQHGLRIGIPKELARLPVPVGRYTRMRASANLRNWLAFATLRCAEDAQFEIREYAHAVVGELRKLFPRTVELFLELGRGP